MADIIFLFLRKKREYLAGLVKHIKTMIKINIKALSTNQLWTGRRFKTDKYKGYEKELFYLLPKMKIPDKTPLYLKIKTGFSNRNSDLSNMLKSFEDILCKKYGINDKWNFKILLEKEIVKKGEEYISFSILTIKP